jgi:hypothetical protein
LHPTEDQIRQKIIGISRDLTFTDGMSLVTLHQSKSLLLELVSFAYLDTPCTACITPTSGPTMLGVLRALVRLAPTAIGFRCDHRSILDPK